MPRPLVEATFQVEKTMDLLDQESIDLFKDAIRDVTDTFHRYPVVLLPAPGGEVDLLSGKKSPSSSAQGMKGLDPRERGEEIEELLQLSFNRQYLAEKGLIDTAGTLLIGYDDGVRIDGKLYSIAAIHETGEFREDNLLVLLDVVR